MKKLKLFCRKKSRQNKHILFVNEWLSQLKKLNFYVSQRLSSYYVGAIEVEVIIVIVLKNLLKELYSLQYSFRLLVNQRNFQTPKYISQVTDSRLVLFPFHGRFIQM